MQKILEKDIQKQILDYLKLKGILAWKNNTAGIYRKSTDSYIPSQSVGVSDIIGMIEGGRFLAIEVKKPPHGKLSPDQKAFLENVTAKGGLGIVAYSVEDVIRQVPLY